MPRDSSAVYSLPNGYLATTGETVLASQHNTPLEDVAQALTGSLPRNGTGAMQAALPMGGFRITNLGSGSASTDATSLTQVEALIAAAVVLASPPGKLAAYAGPTAPTGWLLCYGQAVSRETYSALFAAIGTTWGAGDGSTTFNVPDFKGRTPFGKDDMGGSAAGRLTTAGSGVDGATLGAVGGSQSHTLTTAELAAHTHTTASQVVVPRDGWGVSGGPFGTPTSGRLVVGSGIEEFSESLESLRQPFGDLTVSLTGSTASGSSGSGDAHNNMPPAAITNIIIKT